MLATPVTAIEAVMCGIIVDIKGEGLYGHVFVVHWDRGVIEKGCSPLIVPTTKFGHWHH